MKLFIICSLAISSWLSVGDAHPVSPGISMMSSLHKRNIMGLLGQLPPDVVAGVMSKATGSAGSMLPQIMGAMASGSGNGAAATSTGGGNGQMVQMATGLLSKALTSKNPEEASSTKNALSQLGSVAAQLQGKSAAKEEVQEGQMSSFGTIAGPLIKQGIQSFTAKSGQGVAAAV
jgi:hypothetical protein